MWVCFGFDGYMHLKQFNILNLICTKVTFKNYRKVLPKFYFGKRSSVHCSSDLVIFFIVLCSQALASIIRTGIRLDFFIQWIFNSGSVSIKLLGWILAFPLYINIQSSYDNALAHPHVAGLPPPVTMTVVRPITAILLEFLKIMGFELDNLYRTIYLHIHNT